MKLLEMGVSSDYPEYLNRKIFISNTLAIILALVVGAPFVVISLVFFRPLTFLPAIAIPLAFFTFLFNYLRLHRLARVWISLMPILLAAIYEAYLSKAGQAVIPGLAMIVLSFSLVIFVVFDLRERGMLIMLSVVILVIMLSLDPLNDWLEMPLDSQVIETGWLAKIVIVISVVSCAGSILVLVFQTRNAERKSAEWLQKSEENQKAMAQNELELKDNLQKLEQARQSEQKRQWTSEGLTKGLLIMRNQHSMKELGDELLAFMVKYVKANQGGLYLVNSDDNDDSYLELLAMYAYDRRKHQQQRVEIGQGLLGQVYLEKETMLLKEIPSSYVRITSGLGEALPRNILVVPFKVNDVVFALIELASFSEFQKHEVQFLESLGESVAVHLQSAKANLLTKQLLETSQQQTEEMRSQEEEMRQNMEELSATQEEMVRKEQEYVRRIQELESALHALEATRAT